MVLGTGSCEKHGFVWKRCHKTGINNPVWYNCLSEVHMLP